MYYIYIYIYTYIYIYKYIYIYILCLCERRPVWRLAISTSAEGQPAASRRQCYTPGLHSKIPPHKIFARVWVAQEPICS